MFKSWFVGILLCCIDTCFGALDWSLSLALRCFSCRQRRRRRGQERQRVVIVGGGFAGLHALRRLRARFDVTLIDRKHHFEYTPGILRAFVEPAWLDRLTAPLPPRSSSCCCDSAPRLLRCLLSLCCGCCGLLGGGGCGHNDGDDSVRFVCGQATQVTARSVRVRPSSGAAVAATASAALVSNGAMDGEEAEDVQVEFDYLLLGSGSSYTAPIKSAYLRRRQPVLSQSAQGQAELEEQTARSGDDAASWQQDEGTLAGRRATFQRFHERLCRAATVLIVGAGPVGVELAAEILSCTSPRVRQGVRQVIITDMAREVCPALPARSRAHLTRWLAASARCELELGTAIGGTFPDGLLIDTRGATLSDGRRLEADLVFRCTGFRAETVGCEARHVEEGGGSATAQLKRDSGSGALLVDEHLRLLRADGGGPALGGVAFGMGDCCMHASAEPKLGHTAEVNAELAARNVMRLAAAAAAAAERKAGGCGYGSTAATTANRGAVAATALLSYPQGVVGAERTPRIFCISLGKYDASLCFNGLVINGPLAALVKHGKLSPCYPSAGAS